MAAQDLACFPDYLLFSLEECIGPRTAAASWAGKRVLMPARQPSPGFRLYSPPPGWIPLHACLTLPIKAFCDMLGVDQAQAHAAAEHWRQVEGLSWTTPVGLSIPKPDLHCVSLLDLEATSAVESSRHAGKAQGPCSDGLDEQGDLRQLAL